MSDIEIMINNVRIGNATVFTSTQAVDNAAPTQTSDGYVSPELAKPSYTYQLDRVEPLDEHTKEILESITAAGTEKVPVTVTEKNNKAVITTTMSNAVVTSNARTNTIGANMTQTISITADDALETIRTIG